MRASLSVLPLPVLALLAIAIGLTMLFGGWALVGWGVAILVLDFALS